MAGHRKQTGAGVRTENRNQVWRDRIARAPTAEQVFAVAADWLRSSCHNHPDPAVRQRVLTEQARQLAALADDLDHERMAG